jgi:UDP-N-acetyl-D-glucosamine dehydrogenase
MRIAIIGQGYVGKALGIAAHEAKHEVIGIEIDSGRISELKESIPYFISNKFSDVKKADIVVIAVPTPLSESRQPDLSHLNSACESLVGNLKANALVVNESTSFPGTLRDIIAPSLGKDYLYASAPERIDPANAFWKIKNTPRLIGGLSNEAQIRAEEFYRSICDEVVLVSSPEVAEAAKLFENSFRQVNIALVNEFAKIMGALNIPTFETISAAATKPFGFMRFLPSIGVGGHCIPVDPAYLGYVAESVGVESAFINLASEVNESMPIYIANLIAEHLGGNVHGKNIQVVGISYKANVPDIRESPSLKLISILRKMGANVIWHDEIVGTWNLEESSRIQMVDVGIIATFHAGVDLQLWKEAGIFVADVSTDPNTGFSKLL